MFAEFTCVLAEQPWSTPLGAGASAEAQTSAAVECIGAFLSSSATHRRTNARYGAPRVACYLGGSL